MYKWKPDVEPRELTLRMAIFRESRTDTFEELMRAHERQVLRTALRLLGNAEDARDAAQEVFLRLHKYRRSFDEEREVAPWLYRVTVNVCHDLRRRRRELPMEGPEPSSGPESDAALDLEARRRLVREGLKTLPDKERAAVVLRDIEGLSTREVAGILGSSEATVRSQISMARLKLRKFLARRT